MDLMSAGLSGVRSASFGLAVTANNVANVNTPDFRAQRLDFEEGAPGSGPLRETPGLRESSNVDLAVEITNLQVQSGAYRANLKVIQTADEILGATLDMKA